MVGIVDGVMVVNIVNGVMVVVIMVVVNSEKECKHGGIATRVW